MNRRTYPRKVWWLIGLNLLVLAFCALLYLRVPLSGERRIDGIIGVLLGLYISAHPAENLLDLLFYARETYSKGFRRPEIIFWWSLNAVSLFVGWLSIFTALIRFTSVR